MTQPSEMNQLVLAYAWYKSNNMIMKSKQMPHVINMKLDSMNEVKAA